MRPAVEGAADRVEQDEMPPPPKFAVLPERVELLRVRMPTLLFRMPPPRLLAVLPERVELETVRVPRLLKAPAAAPDELFAPETVTPEMLRSPLASMVKILKPPTAPLMISKDAPGPVMVRAPAVAEVIIMGNAAVKAMVPVTPVLKTISSLPGVVLARVIAASRDPGPEAAVFRTVIGAGTILPSSWRSWGGAGSSCFSILGVAKEFTERI